MSMKKTLTIVAAAGALAAISVPAMAFENEFHGTYTFNSIFSNFQDGSSGNAPAYTVSGRTGYVGIKDKAQTNNYFEQRARIQYIAKASDDLKLVTHFELDTRFGGITNGKYVTGNDSGTLDTDGITLETKHVYLDANLGKNFNLKTGLMPYQDTIKGLLIAADVPAIVTTTKLGAYTLGLGYARFNEAQQAGAAAGRLGDRATDLFIWDNTFAVNKDTKAAFSYYFLADYKQNSGLVPAGTMGNYINLPAAGATGLNIEALLLHTLALSGESKVGPASLSGFFAMQAGHIKTTNGLAATPTSTNPSVQLHGWAANLAAKMAVGPGTVKTAFLFTSGNNGTGNHYKGWLTSGVNSYNEGGMAILARNTGNSPTSTDRYIRRNVQNIALLTMGYDASLTKEIYANANVGFAWAPSSGAGYNPAFNAVGAANGTYNGAPVDAKTGLANASDFMGTEINLEGGYKVSDNLTLRAQAAYAMLGGYYKGAASNSTAAAVKDPENPYTMRLLASFKF